MVITVYGISNCDTVKRARQWLQRAGVAYVFHDLRADSLSAATVDRWLDHCGWEQVLNRRSTTWKALPAQEREVHDREQAKALLLAHPTLVKRPVTDTGKQVLTGFSAPLFETTFRDH